MIKILLLSLYFTSVYSQGCLNQNGSPVQWWAILKVPPKIGSIGFGYFDSTNTHSEFQYIPTHVDVGSTALTQTLYQINDLVMSTIAWNDEKPSGPTNTKLAHSKAVIAFSQTAKKGYLLSHSLPKYPAFSSDHKINVTIDTPQNYYGQHLFCISLSLIQLNKLASHLVITRPYIYQGNVHNSSQTNYLAQLAANQHLKVQALFQTQQFNPTTKTNMKSIFKNGYENSSIFEDGLNNYLRAPLVTQTWGRPLEVAWCGQPYPVTNVKKVIVGQISWVEDDDHSKWVSVGSQYACFGDMNRMPTQWKRGGSFFCLSDVSLATALKRTILQVDHC